MNPGTTRTTTHSHSHAEPESHLSTTPLVGLPGMAYRLRHDPARTIEFVSASCQNLFGITPEMLVSGQIHFHQLIHAADRERVRREIETALVAHKIFQVEYRFRHAHGHWLAVWEQGRGIQDSDGKIIAIEGYLTDVTGRTEAEHARRTQEFEAQQNRKNKSINLLASGIAHDFNNVIAGILGSAELVKMELENQPDHPSHEFLAQIFQSGERARELVHQIKAFSQRPPSDRRLVQLPPLLLESLQIIRSIIPQKVEVAHHFEPDCPAVLADAAQVQQAVLNLCTNAWLSMPERAGRIELKLEVREVDEATVKKHPDLRPGNYVCVAISDDGHGFSKSAQERLFEPFAHKRSTGKKCGLELYTVQETMHAHEGAVVLESKLGNGATFKLFFPTQS